MMYQLYWKQTYTGWIDYAEKLIELRLELSDFSDAKKIIDRVKSL